MDNVYSASIDQNEVSTLLNEMRDAHGMEIGGGIANANSGQVSAGQKNDVDEMQKKLD
jgi:hypothetical protein